MLMNQTKLSLMVTKASQTIICKAFQYTNCFNCNHNLQLNRVATLNIKY